MTVLHRRALLVAGFAACALPGLALAGPPAGGRLRFTVLRNGKTVGQHQMTFVTTGDGVAVTTEADMVIKIGPVPVFRYKHHAEEQWRGGRLQTLATRTSSNGKIEQVNASRTGAGLAIEGTGGTLTAPAAAAPLSHWNSQVLAGPLFNPQTGRMLKCTAAQRGPEPVTVADGSTVQASHWAIRGETQIDDYYDPAGVWVALKGVLPDKSLMEYHRA